MSEAGKAADRTDRGQPAAVGRGATSAATTQLPWRPNEAIAGKIVAITGATAGIGRTVAEVFAERGCRVVGCGRREDRGRKLEAQIRSSGGTFTYVPADVSLRAELRSILDTHGVDPRFVDQEIRSIGAGHYAKTASRSVLGVMNEFAYLGDAHRQAQGADDDLVALSVRIAETPTSPLYKRHISADRELAALVQAAMI